MIVLPNGFNVYPEDIENALRIAGIRDSVVLETEPGRIEAVVLGSATGRPAPARRRRPSDPAAVRARLDAAVKAANATLGPNQRIAGWRLWPEEDFPRTHTLKIKRAQIARLGRVDATAAGRRPAPDRPSAQLGGPGYADPERLERGLDRRPPTDPCERGRQPVVEDDRRADLADDVTVPCGRLDRGRARSRGRPAARRRPRRPAPGRRTRRRR